MNDFANNPDYITCERLLIKLHHLIAQGKGDDAEADAVRDAMNAPWYKLSRAESDRADGLSADLYMLQDEEIYEPYAETQENLREALHQAHRGGDSLKLLRLLRQGPTFIPSYGIASLRVSAYQDLGHLDAALLFLRYGLSQVSEPDLNTYREYFQMQIINLLVKLNRYVDAIIEIEANIDRFTDRNLRFITAHTLIVCAEHMEFEVAFPLLQQGKAVIKSILDDPAKRNELSPMLISNSFQDFSDYPSSEQREIAERTYQYLSSSVNPLQSQFASAPLPVAA